MMAQIHFGSHLKQKIHNDSSAVAYWGLKYILIVNFQPLLNSHIPGRNSGNISVESVIEERTP